VSDKYDSNLFNQPQKKDDNEGNGIEEFYVCVNCGMAYSNILYDKYDGKCKNCQIKLKLRK